MPKNSEAYTNGYNANEAGFDSCMNPYDGGSDEWLDWIAGFEACEADYSDKESWYPDIVFNPKEDSH